ncbi:unnamed protein product [Symbiodinium natans]|uniref:Uncharacterized protein n=1 Tax=Symbiodinium natans TaxID=878477 RepID=A0A812UNB8_9DINO|nr:unnamed protein product [Symbiodinium natans]
MLSGWRLRAAQSTFVRASQRLPIAARFHEEDWEAELLAWKKKYGCPDAVCHEPEECAGAATEPETSPQEQGQATKGSA